MPNQQDINYVNVPQSETQVTVEHGTGYRVFHSILIVLGVLLVLLCFALTFFVRHQLKYRSITNALNNKVKLSDANVPGEGKTVAAYIRAQYVKDDLVKDEDVAEAVDCMELPAFVGGKVAALGDLLRGTSDKLPAITEQEVVDLLEEHEHDLYRKCMLVIEVGDKQSILSELESPLGTINSGFDTAYGSAAMRALARFRVSIWMVLIELALLGLLLWRWTSVYRNSGKRKRLACKAMGRTLMIAGGIVFAVCAVTGIMNAFTKDGVVGLTPLWKAIREPFWISSMLTISAGAILIIIAQIMDIRDLKKLTAPQTAQSFVASERAAAPVIAPARAQSSGSKFCIYCGKSIAANATFCSYCGKKLNGDPEPVQEVPAPAVPETPAVPDVPEQPDVPEIPAEPDVPAAPSVPEAADESSTLTEQPPAADPSGDQTF